jgi:hypothetical protein
MTAKLKTNGNNRTIDHHMTIMLMNIPIKAHWHGFFLKLMLMAHLLGEICNRLSEHLL